MVQLTLLRLIKFLLIVSTLSCYVLLRQAMQDKQTYVVKWMERSEKGSDTSAQLNFSDQLSPSCISGHALGTPPFVRDANCVNCSRLTCKALLSGSNGSIYTEARAFMKEHKLTVPPDKYYRDLARDCFKFKRVMGYRTRPMSDKEANFPIAFNLLIHTDLEQVERLLRALYHPQNSYCIHIDAKAKPSMQDSVRAIAACFSNVFVASKLERVVYAGFTRLQADINCMRDQVIVPTRWRYLLNVAGQAFPLRTNLELVQILQLYNGYNDIEALYHRTMKKRINFEWNETESKGMIKTGRKKAPPPHSIEIVRGSAYGVFSRAFVVFVLTDQKAKDLLEWSRSTYSPDEHYWSTLHHTYVNPHLNTPGAYSGRPDSKPWLAAFALWGGRDKCHGVWRHGSCVFGVEDLPILIARRELFANKLYSTLEPLTLICLEAWIRHKEQCHPKIDYDFYAKLPFTQKAS